MSAPVLSSPQTINLPSVHEGTANPAVILIANLLPAGLINDVDGVVEAIAITGLDIRLGVWQYSLDGGVSWLTINADWVNSAISPLALLLGPSAMVRMLPFGDLNGILPGALSFRAWDMSDGLASGSYHNITATGGGSAFSSAVTVAGVGVMTVNDAPTFEVGDGLNFINVLEHDNWEDRPAEALVRPDGSLLIGSLNGYSSEGNVSVIAVGADGQLDSSFGQGGKWISPNGSLSANLDLALQADGKVLVVVRVWNGHSIDTVVTRLTAAGELDASFGNGGRVVLSGNGNSNAGAEVAMLADGRIVVAEVESSGGDGTLILHRFTSAGTLDTSFDGDGRLVVPAGKGLASIKELIVQSDGRLLMLGASRDGSPSAVVRLNQDGTLDTSFGGGRVGLPLSLDLVGSTMALQADGKIVVGGYLAPNGINEDYGLVRLNGNGSLDTSFSGDGQVAFDMFGGNDRVHGVAVQSDGSILVIGQSTSPYMQLGVARLLANGELDTSFSEDGKVFFSEQLFAEGVDLFPQADGAVVMVASGEWSGRTWNDDVVISRLAEDGSVDQRYPGDGISTLGDGWQPPPGSAPAIIDSQIQVFDPELAALNGGLGNYGGSWVKIARAGDSSPDDLFSAAGSLVFSVGQALLNGQVVGSVTNGAGELRILFNDNATQAVVNQVLSSIAYSNQGSESLYAVSLDWQFSDGNAGAQGVGGALATVGRTRVSSSWTLPADDDEYLWLSGAPVVGQRLTAEFIDSQHLPEGSVFQWYRNGIAIEGATATSYVLQSGDEGAAIAARVGEAPNDWGTQALLASSAQLAVFPDLAEFQRDLLEMYVIITGRAADAGGLAFWSAIVEQGKSLDYVAGEMWDTVDAKALYPRDLPTEQVVTSMYNNILNRDPDADGLRYWVGQWTANGPVATMREMINALESYAGSDSQVLADKQIFFDKVDIGGYLALTLQNNDLVLARDVFDYLEADHSLQETAFLASPQLQAIGEPQVDPWLI